MNRLGYSSRMFPYDIFYLTILLALRKTPRFLSNLHGRSCHISMYLKYFLLRTASHPDAPILTRGSRIILILWILPLFKLRNYRTFVHVSLQIPNPGLDPSRKDLQYWSDAISFFLISFPTGSMTILFLDGTLSSYHLLTCFPSLLSIPN